MRILVFLFSAFQCLSAHAQDFPQGSEKYITQLFPFAEGSRGVMFLQPNTPPAAGAQLAPAALPCAGNSVQPATPGQSTKNYHVDALLQYDASKIPGDRAGSPPNGNANRPGILTGDQSACLIAQTRSTARRPDGSLWCQAPRSGRYVMMSDLFYCGAAGDITFYRGYWEGADILDTFSSGRPMSTSINEHILTTSLGRADSNIDRGGFRDFVAGGTYPVERPRFLFFTEATQADILAIDKAVSNSANTYSRCKDGSFVAKPEVCK